MNKNIFIIFLFALFGCTQTIPPDNDISNYGYSPLWKYRDFPMKRVSNTNDFDPNNVAQMYTTVKFDYMVQQGIISNSNYVYLSGNNVVYYSNGNTTTLYTFSSMSGIDYLDANLKYVAFLSNSNLIVINTNDSNCLSITVEPSNFIFKMANNNSSILVYGNLSEGKDHDSLVYMSSKNSKILNFKTYKTNELPEIYGFLDFSRNNKYLILGYFTSNWCSWNIDALTNTGIFCCYDIETDKSIIAGDYSYEVNNASAKWSDVIVGISENLSKFYVYETKTVFYATGSGSRIDGRKDSEITGVWEIDISSLGLTE